MSVFENEHYEVVLEDCTANNVRSNGADFHEAYFVVNKTTRVTEFIIPQLPEAISCAEQLAVAMETKPWEWVRKQTGVGIETHPDGSLVEPDGEVH